MPTLERFHCIILVYKAEPFHLHSTNEKDTNSLKVPELMSSQEETDTRVMLYCMYAKQKRLSKRSHKSY